MTPRSTCVKIGLIPLATLGTLALASGGPAGASSKATTKRRSGPRPWPSPAQGLHNAATADIAPGKSLNLTVTFTDGKYDIFCPVADHKAMGMNVNIVVTGGAAHATSSTTAESPASTATSSGGVSY